MSTTPISLHFQDGCAVSFEFPQPVAMQMSTSSPPAMQFDVGTVVTVDVEKYRGAYEVTPSGEAQTLPTEGLRMTGDVTIAPIPSNYGLVTWNGSVLTVS